MSWRNRLAVDQQPGFPELKQPGAARVRVSTRNELRQLIDSKLFVRASVKWRNRLAVETPTCVFPGLKQPGAMGRNRVAV